MKILFITNELKDFLGYDPLGIMFLAGALKEDGHKVDITSANLKIAMKVINQFKPDILAYRTTTGYHNHYIKLNREIKKHISIISLFGGPHPTHFPQIIEEKGIDGICIGEGEKALVAFANAMRENKDVSKLQNWNIKKEDTIFKNSLHPLIYNLDDLPIPDRDSIYRKNHYGKYKVKTFMASRGCPFNCTYCSNHHYKILYQNDPNSSMVRLHSVDRIINEVKKIKKDYPIELIDFQDDVFGISQAWLKEFHAKFKKEVNIPFICNLRIEQVTGDFIHMLKESGCKSISIGIETGNDILRKETLKRNIEKNQILNASNIIKNNGIFLSIFNILGIPGETLETAYETLYFNIKCKSDYSWVTLYNPYPATELANISIKKGLFNGDFNKILPTFHNKSILVFKDKSKIERLQKLFAIGVAYPFLLLIIKFLVQHYIPLPYNFIRKSFKAIYYIKKRFSISFTLREIIRYSFIYFTRIGG